MRNQLKVCLKPGLYPLMNLFQLSLRLLYVSKDKDVFILNVLDHLHELLSWDTHIVRIVISLLELCKFLLLWVNHLLFSDKEIDLFITLKLLDCLQTFDVHRLFIFSNLCWLLLWATNLHPFDRLHKLLRLQILFDLIFCLRLRSHIYIDLLLQCLYLLIQLMSHLLSLLTLDLCGFSHRFDILYKLVEFVTVFLEFNASLDESFLFHDNVFTKFECLFVFGINCHLGVEQLSHILHNILDSLFRWLLTSRSKNVFQEVSLSWREISNWNDLIFWIGRSLDNSKLATMSRFCKFSSYILPISW